MKNSLFLFFALFALQIQVSAQSIINLSNNPWKLWPDEKAEWINDPLFLPPIDLQQIPANLPTCGWEGLNDGRGKNISIPATVEEHTWGSNGNFYGISGNYVGVSWFWTQFKIPIDWKDKRVILRFESCRMRAEIFVNQKLVGYDLINGTPIEIEISQIAEPGKISSLAVRITDPNGNFTPHDHEPFAWGKYLTPPSYGFGGITGPVTLVSTDQTYVSDIFIKNKPDMYSIDIETKIESNTNKQVNGKLVYTISENQNPENALLSKSIEVKNHNTEKNVLTGVTMNEALLWSNSEPNLYVLKTEWQGADGSRNVLYRKFGFRWFEVKEVDGDQMFFLNGSRIVLRSATTFGFWPINGLFPSEELAKKQIQTARSLGLNMISFRKCISQPLLLDYADELGMLVYEEPGGYPAGVDPFTKKWNREKLFRMIKRDRNHPSLIIYNLMSDTPRTLSDDELKDLTSAHQLDETRVITSMSSMINNNNVKTEVKPIKSHLLPYQHKVSETGWYEVQHPDGPGVYSDNIYEGPNQLTQKFSNKNEIIFLGSEGGIGIPSRTVQLKDQFTSEDNLGWDGEAYLNLNEAYENFLNIKGFRKIFSTKESFMISHAKTAYYYHGRSIENFRISNTGDAYTIHNWESSKVGNNSGIVDIFRNTKAFPAALAYYNQPLYIPVKLTNKVFETGGSSKADIYIINERDLNGPHTLYVKAEDGYGTFWEQNYEVNIKGGNTFGELLVKDIVITPEKTGLTKVSAQLLKDNVIVTSGYDEIYTVEQYIDENQAPVAIWDNSGTVKKILDKTGKIKYKEYNQALPGEKCMLVGPEIITKNPNNKIKDNQLIDWVSQGNTLIVIKAADQWADFFAQKEIADYRGRRDLLPNEFGGNYFVRDHEFFDGLPVNTAFNWEYQCLAQYNNNIRFGLRLMNDECIVGAIADHKQELLSAVSILKVGQGQVILSTLDLESAIMSDTPSSIVAKKILANYIQFGLK